MGPLPQSSRFLTGLVALVLVGIFYVLSRDPTLSEREAAELASRFRFSKLPLPELAGVPYKRTQTEMVRAVHPSLRHVSSFVSFVGAAVALADLDGDGLPNDLLLVDPRVDQVMVAPAPGTGERFEPFALSPSPLAYVLSWPVIGAVSLELSGTMRRLLEPSLGPSRGDVVGAETCVRSSRMVRRSRRIARGKKSWRVRQPVADSR
jgi:hypothetical protein